MRLLTGFLFAASFPALAQPTLKIQSLGTPATVVVEHYNTTGDTNGALAVSPTGVFYNGDTATGLFTTGLSSPQQLPPGTTRYYALVSDLADGSVYEFINRAGNPPVDTRLSPANVGSRPLTHLKNIASGNAVALSSSITLSGNEGIFAGLGRVVIVDGTAVYDIAMPSGAITPRTVPGVSPVLCEQWMSWGVAEFFDNALHLAYVRTNRIISRTRVPDGATSDILSTGGQGLSNMCAFSVLAAQNRWYFQHSDASVLGGQTVNGNNNFNDEFLGYAPATFLVNTDVVPPTTTLTATTAPNANNWYNTSVTVAVSATDSGGSGVKNTQCSINGAPNQIVGPSVSLTAQGVNTLSCFSTDNATPNNIESPAVTLTVKIDSVAPAITFSNRTAANAAGWNNTNVIVSWSCSDAGSGPVAPTVSNTLSTEGADQTSTGTCSDLAGNTATNQQIKISIDKTPPSIEWGAVTPAANAAGWHNANISVGYSAADTLSGLPSGAATGNVAISAEGQSVTGSVTLTDIAGNSATYTTQAFRIDKTAPGIVGSRLPAANAAGWNNVDVTVSFACTDSLSGVNGGGPAPTTLGEGANQSVTKSCLDNAGNSASATVSDINVDKTAPVIEGGRVPLANAAGWNNVDVTVTFTCSDPLSGLNGGVPAPTTLGEGANQSVTKSCSDNAGNSASATVSAINIDKTAPVASPTLNPAANAAGWNNTNVNVNFGWSDTLSGLDACTASQAVTTEGANQSASASCTDKAGNSFTATKSGINVDKTAPTIEGSRLPLANAAGWNNVDVTVSFTCSDSLSGLESALPAPTTLGEGANQSVTKSCSDKAGNSASATVNAINIDKTAPVANPTLNPAANAAGWNNTNVTVNFAWSDGLSGLDACTASQAVTTEGANQSASASCTDKAGNSFTSTKSGINVDKTAPVIEGSRLPLANGAGWNNVDVTVSFTCSDPLSGLNGAAPAPTTLGEGQNQSVTKSCSDNAGNSASATVSAINIDKTAPVANPTLNPAANAAGWNNTNLNVNFGWSDALSGLDTCTASQAVTTEGANQSVSASCTDKAGNSFTATKSGINVDKTAPVIEGSRLPLANGAGWNNVDVTVSFTCNDPLSGLNGVAPTPTTLGEGKNQSVTKSCTDNAGNSASATVGAINIDKTPPVANSTLNPVANAAGWNNTNVTVHFGWSDPLSGLAACTETQTMTNEGDSQTASASCTDLAGNSFTATKPGINIDKTPPTIQGSRSPGANAAGWNNVDVTVSFTCSDPLSGLNGGMPAPTTLGEGANQSVTKSCSDNAGNSASATVGAINIDKTAPVANFTLVPAANAAGWNNTNVDVNFGWSDALSGTVSCPPTQSMTTEGPNQSTSASCTDKAGNSFTATKSGINIDKTAPTIQGSRLPLANGAGWNNADVTVSFTCSDPLSGLNGGVPAPTTLGEGPNQSVTKSCSDNAGNTASATVNAINIDKTPPVANPTLVPAANGYGWNNTNVSVNFAWVDSLSGRSAMCTMNQSMTNEGASQTASASCTDNAGNSSTATKPGINIDKTLPSIAYAAAPAANAAGWNNTDVTVTFTGADSLSGLVGCTGPFTLVTEGGGQLTTGTCTDRAGNFVSATSITNIDKTAPLPRAVAGTPNPVSAGTLLKVTATVADALASGYLASAEYKIEDGAWTPLLAVDGTYNSPTENVYANATAGRTPGVYDLCVRGTDAAGNTGPADCVFVVIYDPNGGFVTGGGWITSLPGAYTANPLLTGKAHFGFVSKYLKGATVPTGETQFEFKLAGLNFRSTVYEWLTVAGARAQYKGSGKINGAGDYGFLLTAIDGETNGGGGADKFRIKIWDKVSPNTIVYDNQINESDEANPTTLLGGGSIVIHTNSKP